VKIMLDTNAYVGFKRNAVETVEIIVRAELILFSPVVLGELRFGFRNGTRFKENMEALNSFLEHEAVELVQIGKTEYVNENETRTLIN
jgi:tRNA(fMet)-specific endonuclease VapC